MLVVNRAGIFAIDINHRFGYRVGQDRRHLTVNNLDDHRWLNANIRHHRDHLSLAKFGDGDLTAEPAIFPLCAPGRPGRDRFKGQLLQGFIQAQLVISKSRFPGNLAQRLIEMLRKFLPPGHDPMLPFQVKCHDPSSKYLNYDQSNRFIIPASSD